jgi:hypothetical protein
LEQGAWDAGTGANTAPNPGNRNLTIRSWLTPGIPDIGILGDARGGKMAARADSPSQPAAMEAEASGNKKKDRSRAILEKVQQGGVKQSGGSHSGSGEPEHVSH